MENIEDIRIRPCTNSKYVQPFRVLYKQVKNGFHPPVDVYFAV